MFTLICQRFCCVPNRYLKCTMETAPNENKPFSLPQRPYTWESWASWVTGPSNDPHSCGAWPFITPPPPPPPHLILGTNTLCHRLIQFTPNHDWRWILYPDTQAWARPETWSHDGSFPWPANGSRIPLSQTNSTTGRHSLCNNPTVYRELPTKGV